MKVVSVKMDEELATLLEMYARRKNITKSEAIRRAVRYYLSRELPGVEPVVTKKMVVL